MSNPSVARRVAVGTVFQVGGRVAGLALALVSVGLLTRYLGPSGFGRYSLAILIGTIATTVADLGLFSIGLREISAGNSERDLMGGIIRLKTIVQTPVFAVIAGVVLVLPIAPSIRGPIAVAVAAAATTSWTTSLQLPFQRDLRFAAPVIADLVGRVTFTVLLIELIHHDAHLTPLIGALWLANFTTFSLLAYLFHRRRYSLRGRLSREESRQLLWQSVPLGAILLLGFLHFKVDSLILAADRSDADLGVYSVAYRVIEVLVTLPGLFLTAAFPVLSRYYKTDPERYRAAVQKSLDFLCITGFPLIFVIIATAPRVVEVLAGSHFTKAVLPLRLLAIAALFSWLNSLFAQLSTVTNQQRRVLWVSGIGLGVNVAMNLIVIPRYGYNGAAITTLISEALGSVMVAVVVLRGSPVALSLGRPARAAGCALAASGLGYGLVSVDTPSGLVWSATAVVFTAAVLLSRTVRLDEIRDTLLP